MTHYQAIGLAG